MDGIWIIRQEEAPIPRFKSTSTMAMKFLRKRENSMSIKGPHLFDTLSPHLRNSAGQSLAVFKTFE